MASTEPPQTGKARLTEENTRYARIAGHNISIRRKQMGLTQRQFANALTANGYRVSYGTIGFIELARISSGQPRGFSVDQLMTFAEFFGCEPMELLTPSCETCEGAPPAGFTCNACGGSTAAPEG